jgi:hypothetical protein
MPTFFEHTSTADEILQISSDSGTPSTAMALTDKGQVLLQEYMDLVHQDLNPNSKKVLHNDLKCYQSYCHTQGYQYFPVNSKPLLNIY